MIIHLAVIAVAAAFLSSMCSISATRRPQLMRWLVFPLLGLSGIAAMSAGLGAIYSGGEYIANLNLGLPWEHWQMRLDALAGLFFALIGLGVSAISLYGPGYVREFEHGSDPLSVLGIFTGLFIAGMLLVVLANDAYMFMVSWELMSLSSYFLVSFQHENAANRRAAFLYLLMAHIGGLCILLGYGVLAAFGGDFTFAAMRAAELSPVWASVAFLLAFIGFGMKAGLVPVHVWLPEAHPVAPSHISALMSGVMLKVAVYGFIRFTYDLLGNILEGWGVLVLIIGSASALMGVLYAMMQTDVKRILAYSSVENLGIIFIGLGLSMIFFSQGMQSLGILGLLAALFHCINHTLFKSALFLGAGAILHTSHEHSMENMGGLLRNMPWTGTCFLIACLSISGLPPFNGFASEWLTFQTALQIHGMENGILRSLIPVSAAMLALTSALAVACFVRVYGVAFLGQARSRHVRHAREVSPGMCAAQAILAGLCLLTGVLPTWVLSLLDRIPQQLFGHGVPSLTAEGWAWLTPVSPDVASYGAPVVVVGIGAAWLIVSKLLKRGEAGRIRRCQAWDCGFSPLNPRMQYTGTAFAMPFRRVFGLLFHIGERVEDNGKDVRHDLQITDRLWGLLYQPVARMVMASARRVRVMQSGRLRAYLAWSFGTLLVLLWIIS